jgi:hypothetical protein
MLIFKKNAQAFAEFMLVLIPFLILAMGVLQFAHIAVVKVIVNHAVFTATRVASVQVDESIVEEAAYEAIPFEDKDNIDVVISPKNGGEDVQVQLTYNMELIFPFANKVIKELKELKDYRLPITSEYILPMEGHTT